MHVIQSSRSLSQNYGIMMWNMKALSLTDHKLWLRLEFFKSRSNFKVKVKKLWYNWKVLSQGTWYTCEIWKPCLSRFISYDQGKSFWKVGQTSSSRSLSQNYGITWKVLSQRKHMWNTKVLFVVHKLTKVKALVYGWRRHWRGQRRCCSIEFPPA